MALKKYKVHAKVTLTVYAENTHEAMNQVLDHSFGIYEFGNNRVHSIDEPLPVLDTSNRYGLIQPLIMEYHGNGGCHPVSKPLPTVTGNDRFALITLENVRIGFRMLKPHELAAAQSFPRDYIFTGSKADVVKQIGNAVCPKMSLALTQGYMHELAEEVS